MKDNIYKFLFLFLFISLFRFESYAQDQFNFDITEVEILEEGNIFKGYKRGKITTNNGISINADKFDYNKKLNILNSYGDVLFYDNIKNVVIVAEKSTYLKNEEKIFTEGNSKAINDNGITITADKFRYDKILNIFNAYGNVKIDNPEKNYTIYAKEATYLKNEEKIFTKGKTKALVQSQYIIDSKNVIYLVEDGDLSSKEETIINDQESNFYYLDEFKFNIEKEELKGNEILVITNFGLPKSDKMFFTSANINFKENSFIAQETKILIDKNIFDDPRNDPRLKGVSSKGKDNITVIKKGVFTNCGSRDGKCPPWHIKAKEIIHDKNKRQITYNSAFLNFYDIPVLYFPKFFHPDPSVRRQSGLLKPQMNESSVLGTSFYVPYFYVISDTKDLTIRPTYFDKEIYMLQGEYRQENENSQFMADIGLTAGYRSPEVLFLDNGMGIQNNKSSLFHFFSTFKKDLNIDNFITSSLTAKVQKASNPSYLKVFENSLSESTLTPGSKEIMSSDIQVILDHQDYSFDTGISATENLTKLNNEKYNFTFPYYNFNKSFFFDDISGSFNFYSKGNNSIDKTSSLLDANNIDSQVFNDLNYQSRSFISDSGFSNSFNAYYKNANTLSTKDNKKKSPEIEFGNIYQYVSTFPLSKRTLMYSSTISPKISYRINPNNVKGEGGAGRRLSTANIFSINRLAIEDSFESGQSLTYGVSFNKQNLQNESQSFDYSIAAVMRTKRDANISETTTINDRHSDYFGSFKNQFNKNFGINYNFAVDNNLKKFHYNSISIPIEVNNFVTTFSFIEENSLTNDINVVSNNTSYNIGDNFFTFKTRRNRKINLTEYYDLIYEYRNDCLLAGIKYKKTYYEDREIKPREDLLLTVTFIPLTTYEHKADSWDF